jgi:hypothetical protein
MNRQSRKLGTATWTDRGAVSFKDAAVEEARDWTIGQECLVEVRDVDRPTVIWTLTVQADIRYNVSGLRGGDN